MNQHSYSVFCKKTNRAKLIYAFLFLSILVLVFIQGSLYAQATIDLSKPVGSPKGSGGASGSGGATYSIPIEVLSGTNGMEPNVSLTYNSQGGDGNFGWGWNLSSLSAITRAGKSNYYNGSNAPVSYTNTSDAFVLDGQRLFVTSGTNGSDGAVYGTENENFNRIESFGGANSTGPDRFKVTVKNGTVMEYGNATDATVKADNGNNSNMIWLLNRVTDINGNYQIFHYTINNTDRNFALTEIDYTGNTAQGIQPYNKIQFTYSVKSNWQTQKTFQWGTSLTTPFLLSSILVVNSSGTNVKKYECTYSTLHNQYFLQSFKESGADGTSLNPLTFSYGSNLTASDVYVSPQYPGFSLNNTFTGDISGDGKQDLVVGYYKYDNNGWPYYTSYAVYNEFTQYAGSAGMAMAYNCNITPSSGETQIKTASNYYNFLTFDYDGDSKADVLRINWATSGSDMLFSNIVINYSRYFNVYSGSTYVSQTYSSIPHVSAYTNDFKYAYHSGGVYGTNFIPGDFDGDGAQDYILVLGTNNSNSFKGFFSSPLKGIFNQEITNFGVEGTSSDPFYANSIASATEVTPIDFDGDGKTEILVQKANYSYVVSVSPVSAASGYNYAASTLASTSAIKAGYRVFPGDFNGDGNTDLLVRSSKSDPAGAWNILYSNGRSFASYPFVFQNKPFLEGDNSASNAHLLMIADLNGDGKSDVWHSLDDVTGGLHSKHTIYYSNGIPLPNQNSTTAFLAESYTNTTSINKSASTNTPVGDMNGDGKPDMFSLINSTSSRIVYAKPFKEDRLMTKATDGLGGVSGFYYGIITNNSSVYQRSTTYDYDVSGTAIGQGKNGNPYMVINSPMYVMFNSYAPNGNGSTTSTGYQYQDAAVSSIRGFLGFKQVTATSYSSGIAQTTYSDIDASLLVPHTIRQTTSYGSTNLSDTKITDALTRVASNNYFDKRYTYLVGKTLTTDGLTGAAIESINTYDSYNNVVANVVNKGYLSGTTVTAAETATTATIYGTHGTPVPASPESVTVSNVRGSQSKVSRKTTYTYDTKGNVLTSTDWSGTALAVTTTNAFDNFGNITSKTASATGVTIPSLTYTYDNTGRFLTKKEAAGSSITKKETFTYEPTWGLLASSVSSDGLTTSYTYDNMFGKLTKTTLPDGNAISQSFAWESTGNGRYSITTQRVADGGKSSKQYYDILGRKIKTETGGFNGQTLTSITTYNSLGQASAQTDPYYSGETVITTTTTYDSYGRVTNISNGTSSVSTAYAQLASGQYQVTTTNAAGQASSKTMDAAGRVISSSDNGGQLSFTYDSWGNQLSTQIGSTTVVSSVYDAYGRQTSLTDKNAGTISYEYNTLGKITKQTDALNQVHTLTYDAFGRTTVGTGPEGNTYYSYYSDAGTGKCNDNVTHINGFSGDVTSYSYDYLGNLTTETVTLTDGNTFTKTLAYDNYSNLIKTTYPSGVIINDTYDKNGALIKTTMGAGTTPTPLFEATAMNSKGVYTGYKYGNNKSSTVTYDLAKGAPSRYYTAGVQDLNLNFDGQTGNLLSRNDAIKSLTETFTFDNLNRLTSAKVGTTTQFSITYDGNASSSLGNIATKSDIGNYTYDNNKINAVKFITSTAGGTTPPGVISQNTQDISYTPFLKAATITEGVYSLAYTYGQDQQRIKSVLKQSGTVIETKYYLGAYERQIKGGITRDIHYINAGNGLCAIIVKEGSTITPYFVYSDHLGSILTVTNASGAVVAQQNFDAWGRNRNPTNWTYASVPTVPDWLYRGFTGHEHLAQFALINMNGRMYDPANGRMLSPDNYVPNPWSTQGYNRYGYANNNPLSYTDPDGNFWNFIIGALIGGTVNVVSGLLSGKIHNFGDGLKYFAVGAIAGAVGAGIGSGVSSLLANGSFSAGFLGTSAAKVAATSFFNGAMIGGASGFAGGFLGGAGNAAIEGDKVGQVFTSGLKAGLIGGVTGGLIEGSIQGIQAISDGRRFFDGATVKKTVLVDQANPYVHQSTDANCVAADGESSTNGVLKQNDIRNAVAPTSNANVDGLGDGTVMQYVCSQDGGQAVYGGTNLPTDAVTRMSNGDQIWVNLHGEVNHEVILNRIVEKTITKLSGNTVNRILYYAMDPLQGQYSPLSSSFLDGSSHFWIRVCR